MLYTCFVLLAIALLQGDTRVQPVEPPVCICPQASKEWMLYGDHLPVPDFLLEDTIEVREILVCEHGIHFYFIARQASRVYYISLIVVKPTRKLYTTRAIVRRRSGTIVSMDQRLTQGLATFEHTRLKLKEFLGDAYYDNMRITFEEDDHPPQIYPKEKLKLKWRGSEMNIRGYLDLYYSMFV